MEQLNPAAPPSGDARMAVRYLTVEESDTYIAIMRVLEAATSELAPAEVALGLRESGLHLEGPVVEDRLASLREWGAVSARSDQTHVRRVQDLLLRNFRYTATRAGRQVQRFYDTVLADTTVLREIPLQSLHAVVTVLETLAAGEEPAPDAAAQRARVNELFTSHDDLDASLVGAEDTLMGLADRFDLDDDRTGELKTILVGYATRVAAELERGADRAAIALAALTPRFAELSAATVAGSEAADLIARDLLAASKGGRVPDWEGLVAWFDPFTGRSARFQSRMVAAIPTFYTNLRRLHTSGASGTSRARALVLARACLHPDLGAQVFLAATGDHSWRKLHAETDDPGAGRTPPWRDGPQAPLPPGLRTHGRSGSRGRAANPVDDRAAREVVAARRAERQRAHQDALREVLEAEPGQVLSAAAAQVALGALMQAVRQGPDGPRRQGALEGLACTIVWTGDGAGVLRAATWRVWLPGRALLFHPHGTRAQLPPGAAIDPGGPVEHQQERSA